MNVALHSKLLTLFMLFTLLPPLTLFTLFMLFKLLAPLTLFTLLFVLFTLLTLLKRH